MIRHTLLPAPGKGHRAPSMMAAAPAHHQQRADRGHYPRTRPTFAPLLITDPDTVTTTGRRQPAGHNGV